MYNREGERIKTRSYEDNFEAGDDGETGDEGV